MSEITPFDPTKLTPEQQDIALKIGDAATKAGLNPDLLIPWAFHESSLNPKALGPEIKEGMHKGDRAGGLFQYMTKTANSVGLDDRFDADKNIDSTMQLIKQYVANPSIGSDPKKMLAAWVAGPGSKFVKSGNLDDLNDGELDYLIGMGKRVGGELPVLLHPSVVDSSAPIDSKPPVAKDIGGDETTSETPPEMMPPPFQHVTTQEGAITAGLGASAGFALDMPAELTRLGKYGIDLLRNPNSPASLQRYSNTQLGDRHTNIPLKELEKLTGQRAANQSEVQDIIKTIKGGQPTYADKVTVQRGYGPTARQVDIPVVNGQYIENGIAKTAPLTGSTSPIDISKYEIKPGVYGYGQRGAQAALPVLQGLGRATGMGATGALTAVQAQDALKRLQSGDKTGAGVSAVGSGGSGLSTLGLMARMPKTGALGATLSAGSMGANFARDFYKATPEEREAMMEKLKGLPSALFSPTEESSAPPQEFSVSDSLADFRRRYTPPSKRTTAE
jgi:hypothetical protein